MQPTFPNGGWCVVTFFFTNFFLLFLFILVNLKKGHYLTTFDRLFFHERSENKQIALSKLFFQANDSVVVDTANVSVRTFPCCCSLLPPSATACAAAAAAELFGTGAASHFPYNSANDSSVLSGIGMNPSPSIIKHKNTIGSFIFVSRRACN